MKPDVIPQMIAELYRDVCHPGGWQQFINTLQHEADLSSAILMLDDDRGVTGSQMTIFNQPNEVFTAYRDYYASIDPWALPLAYCEPLKFVNGDELVESRDVTRSEFYADFLRPADIRYICGAYLDDPTSGQGTKIALQRSHSHQAFSERELQTLSLLTPHIANAFSIQRKLHEVSATFEQRCAASTHPVVVLDCQHKLIATNRAAEPLLQASPQSILRLKDRNLDAAVKAMNNRLHSVIDGQSQQTRLFDTLGGANTGYQLRAEALPLPPDSLGLQRIAALIHIKPGNQSRPVSRQGLQALFGLTPSEARVAYWFGQGKAPQQIASSLNIRESTVRSHIKVIYQKTGASKQTELVALFLSSLAS